MRQKPYLLIATLFAMIIATFSFGQGIHQLWGTTTKGGTDDYGTLFRTDGEGKNIQTMYSFPKQHLGATPMYNQLVEYNEKLYAMTSAGGANDLGVLFEWEPVSNTYIKKLDFDLAKGTKPHGSLLVWNNKLYGMTLTGGSNDKGVIFEYDPSVNTYAKKYEFDGITGSSPYGGLTIHGDKLYGMTNSGGANDKGVIFEWDPLTNIYTKLHDFDGNNGSNPIGDLTAHDGKLYGMTSKGGTADMGVIFEWNVSTSDFNKKIDFTGLNGATPYSKLIFFNDRFYGMTRSGGGYAFGVIFEWDPVTNNYSMLHDLAGGDLRGRSGHSPFGSFIEYQGKLYTMMSHSGGGTYTYGALWEWDPLTNERIVKKVYTNYTGDFDQTPQGETPYSSLALMNGKMYGMTSRGGIGDDGVIFEWDPTNNLYSRKISFNGADNGFKPQSLVINGDELYGLAEGGFNGMGVIFKWNRANEKFEKVKDIDLGNGRIPHGQMVKYNGNYYMVSGTLTTPPNKNGNLDWHIVEWDPATNTYSSLYKFPQGSRPSGDLIQVAGKFYGTVAGSLFEWNPVTKSLATLFTFGPTHDNTDELTGMNPGIGLTHLAGKLYGLTNLGGLNDAGVIYEWTIATQTFTKKFDFETATGSKPEGSLLLVDGTFWGTTAEGGANGKGVIFEWDPATNIYNKRYDFTLTDGNPNRNLLFHNGRLYGMTTNGGSAGAGTIFTFNPGSDEFNIQSEFNGLNGNGINNRSNLVALPASVAAGTPGHCEAGAAVIINTDNNNEWVPITDAEGNAIAEIHARGNDLGTVTTSFYINDNSVREDERKRLYLDRSITMTPQLQPVTPVSIRLYIKNGELNDLKNAVNSNGTGSGVNTINDIGIFKNNDGCEFSLKAKANRVLTGATKWSTDHVLTADIESFSTFYFSNKANIALPLTLLEFSGKLENDNVLLLWNTENETGTAEFLVERSIGNSPFTTIGTIAAANRPGNHSYTFTDVGAGRIVGQIVYYRLRQKDIDGQFTYSKLVTINKAAQANRTSLYPNPASNQVNLAIHSVGRDLLNVRVIDVNGKTLQAFPAQIVSGDNLIKIDAAALAKGFYLISIRGKAINQQFAFVK